MAGDISNMTTNLSNLSVSGLLDANRIASTNTISGGIMVGSDLSSTNTARAATLLVGSATAGTAITRIAKGTISVVTMTCTANGSTTTTATVAGLTTADALILNPPSSMSSGINITGYASGNSTAVLIFSNCSTAAQVVAGPLTVLYTAIRS